MAARDITNLGVLMSAAQETQGVHDSDLQSCLTAASVWIETITGRRWKTETYNQWHSGSRATRYEAGATSAQRAVLWLADPATGFATMPVSSVSSVTENGVGLSVTRLQASSAIPTSGQLAIVDDRNGTIVRAEGTNAGFTAKAWERGSANIRIVCSAGYTDETMPQEIVRACCELAWLMYGEGRRSGLEQMAAAGMDVRFVRFLSPNTKRILDLHCRRWSPRTLEG